METIEKMYHLSAAVTILKFGTFKDGLKEAIQHIEKVRDAIYEELEPPKTEEAK